MLTFILTGLLRGIRVQHALVLENLALRHQLAITYMLGLWAGLTRFLNDPRIPIDNNHTERGLRGVGLGRKNHYGSPSPRGTEVAALFYSLIESVKLCGVDPKRYLLTATRAALADRVAVTLPHMLIA